MSSLPSLEKAMSKMPWGIVQMAWFVRVFVHQSVKLKMAETKLTEMLQGICFWFLYICLRWFSKVAPFWLISWITENNYSLSESEKTSLSSAYLLSQFYHLCTHLLPAWMKTKELSDNNVRAIMYYFPYCAAISKVLSLKFSKTDIFGL